MELNLLMTAIDSFSEISHFFIYEKGLYKFRDAIFPDSALAKEYVMPREGTIKLKKTDNSK